MAEKTPKRLTDEELEDLLLELEASGFYTRQVIALAELQERRQAEKASEQIQVVGFLSMPADFDEEKLRLELERGSAAYILYPMSAPPAPVVPDDLLSMAASAIEDLLEHTDPNTIYYSGVWADVPRKLRAAMSAAAPQEVK
ncbi:TPA: hypothetical protein ACHSON_000924 [Raoultella planticola ATCC 33531]